MRINHNIQALNAYRNLSSNQSTMSKHLEKLSSGLRINRASDDAAGLAISEKMRSQVRGLKMAERNALDGISLIQTSEGALTEVHSMLQRMRELAVQSSNDTNTNEDREGIQKEVSQLIDEIDRISANTEFNQLDLLNGARSSNELYGTSDIMITSATNNANITAANNTLNLKMDDLLDLNVNLSAVDYDGSAGKTADDLAKDMKNKLIGIDVTDPKYTAFVSDPNATTFTALNTPPAPAGSIIGQIGNLTPAQLSSKGYIDADPAKAKSKFLNDVVSGQNKFDVKYDETKKRFAIKSNYKLRMDETLSTASDSLGMSNLFKGLDLQIGANIDQIMNVNVGDMSTASLGSGARGKDGQYILKTLKDVQIQTIESANEAFRIVDQAIKQVSEQRSSLGAYQNRLEHTVTSLGATRENLTAAESRIRDTDMALEMSGFTKDNIINQAATAMLSQANQLPQGILRLLQQ